MKNIDISKDCFSFEVLYDYLNGNLPQKEKGKLESHLVKCYYCLDNVVVIYEGINFYNRGRPKLKKESIFLILAIISFIASFIFGRYFLQFLVATIIFGIKWIVDSKTSRMLIMIYDAWRKGGEREAGRILKKIERR